MRILDATCGKRGIWFDKEDPSTVFLDIRPELKPNIIGDATKLPFKDACFDIVVFDPPHMKVGPRSAMAERYGLFYQWQIRKLIYEGFREFARVLRLSGVVLFKWSSHNESLASVLKLVPPCFTPLFGQATSVRTRFSSVTSWVCLTK